MEQALAVQLREWEAEVKAYQKYMNIEAYNRKQAKNRPRRHVQNKRRAGR